MALREFPHQMLCEIDGCDLGAKDSSPQPNQALPSKGYIAVALIPPIMFAWGAIDLAVVQPNQATAEAGRITPNPFPEAETQAARWNSPYKGYLRSFAGIGPEKIFGKPEWYENTPRRTRIRNSYGQLERKRAQTIREIYSYPESFNRVLINIGLIVGGITTQYAVSFIDTIRRRQS